MSVEEFVDAVLAGELDRDEALEALNALLFSEYWRGAGDAGGGDV